MTKDKICPGPEDAGQTGDNEDALVVTKPNRKNDRCGVEKSEGDLVPGREIEPGDGEEQRQRFNKSKRRGRSN